jgi:hypothetical protein
MREEFLSWHLTLIAQQFFCKLGHLPPFKGRNGALPPGAFEIDD